MADNILTTDRDSASIAVAAKEVAGIKFPRNILTDPSGTDITPLTDAALRAMPVPVSGTVSTGLLQAATDAQLRAAALPVALDSASLTALETISIANFPATQPVSIASWIGLTDTQLRATAVQISGIRRDADTPYSADLDAHPLMFNDGGRLKVSTTPADIAQTTGSIIASGGIAALSVKRLSNLAISMVATSLVGHNVSFEASNNSTNGTDGNWYAVQVVRSNANTVESTSGVIAATPAYMWQVNVSDYAYFRVRATAHTSGTAAYIFNPSSYATEPIPAVQVTGTQPVSGTVSINGYPTAAASTDGLTNPTVTQVGAAQLLFNGTSWDRQRGNFNTTTGDTGAKTATGNGATQTNYNAKGATVVFNIGTVSGTTPTLVLKLQGSADSGTTWYDISGAATTSLTATGVVVLQVYPGIAAVANAAVSAVVPRTWRVVWTIGGTTPSFTITNIQVAYTN